MSVNIYVNFNGNCREAVEFYAQAFQTETPQIMTFGEAPQNGGYPLPEEAKDLVMHTRLTIFGSTMMFSDIFPGNPFVVGNNMSLTIVTEDEEALRKAFSALQEEGNVEMDLQETFWSKCYGSLVDKFGVHWQFSYEEK